MRLMLADDSLSPILNMTCYIVKACHLLGYLTDGSLSPEFLMRTFDKMTASAPENLLTMELKKMADFANCLPTLKKINFLFYGTFGQVLYLTT